MSIFKKLFGSKPAIVAEESKPVNKTENNISAAEPDNTRLMQLLEAFGRDANAKTHEGVMKELMGDSAYLLLPSVNEPDEDEKKWKTMEKGGSLQLTSVFNMDGLNVLGAFTDENALTTWSKTRTSYTALPSKSVLELCQANGIDRIVINSDQPTMFVLERNRGNMQTRTFEKETQVMIGTPTNPLSSQTIAKLVANFKKVDTVLEAFQYAQIVEGDPEAIVVIGLRLSTDSENAKAAAFNAIQNAFIEEQVKQPADIFIIEDDDWHQSIAKIENSLFYRR